MLHLFCWLGTFIGRSLSTFLLADQLLRTCGQWCCGLLLDAAAGVVAAVDDLHCRSWSVRPLHPAPLVLGVIITVTVTPSRDDNVTTWRTSASPSPSSWPASARDGRRSTWCMFIKQIVWWSISTANVLVVGGYVPPGSWIIGSWAWVIIASVSSCRWRAAAPPGWASAWACWGRGRGWGAAPPRPSERPGQVSNKSSSTTFSLPCPCRLKWHTTCRVQWRLGCPAPTPCCSEFGYCRSRRGGLGYCRLEIMWPKLLYIHLHYCKLVPCSLEHEIFIEIKCHRIENWILQSPRRRLLF